MARASPSPALRYLFCALYILQFSFFLKVIAVQFLIGKIFGSYCCPAATDIDCSEIFLHIFLSLCAVVVIFTEQPTWSVIDLSVDKEKRICVYIDDCKNLSLSLAK